MLYYTVVRLKQNNNQFCLDNESIKLIISTLILGLKPIILFFCRTPMVVLLFQPLKPHLLINDWDIILLANIHGVPGATT